ncbi:hypothetical protein JXA88_05140 [Candidatus Fermentibacteria bacterium]|nr:hypothetical protein [Candidatus Fermentibacteria bacterium]
MRKLWILVTGILIACAAFAWAKGKVELKAPEAPKVEAPKLEAPKLEAPKIPLEGIEFPTGAPGEAGATGPIIVAMVPFGYTAGVGSEKAIQAANEVAVALQSTGRLQPMSLKDWMDINFKNDKAANMRELLDRAAEVNLPIHFVCTGNLFLSGDSYGLMVSLYPLDRARPASHYFRSTSSFHSLDTIAKEIVREMPLRAFRPAATVVSEKIFVGEIGLSFSLVDEATQKETELDFAACEGVQYYREDRFLADLLHYNLYASGIMATGVGGQKGYFEGKPTADSAYVISGQLKIRKKDVADDRNAEKIMSVTVAEASDPSRVVFSNQYALDRLGLESLYDSSRMWAKDILLSILEPEQRRGVGEVDIPSFYGNEGIYLDDFYLGRGNQANLVVSAGRSVVKTYHTNKWQKERVISISPYGSNEVSGDRLLVGAFYAQGLQTSLPALLFGGGFSFALDRRTHELTVTVSESYGKLNADQFSLVTRVGLAPAILFLPDDSAVRLYGGLGVFAAFWTDAVASQWASFFSLGLFPEGGVTYTIARFRVRVGLGYDFDLVRYVTAAQPAASAAGQDLSGLAGRLSFAYFLK